MIALGLVLLVLVVVLAVAVVTSNPEVVTLYVFNASVPVTMGGLFFTGAGAALVVLVAVWLIVRGVARMRRLQRRQRALAASTPAPPPVAPSASPTPRPAEHTESVTPTTPATADSGQPTTREVSSPTTAEERPTPRAGGAHAVDPTTASVRREPEVTPPSEPVTTDLDGTEPRSDAAERAALLTEADELTRDEPLR